MFEKLKQLIRKKKSGVGMITTVIGTMTFIIVFCAGCDMLMMSNRNSMMTDTGKEIARTLSVQGGSLENKPGGFASNYYTISELSRLVKRNMETAGFLPGEWNVVVKYSRYYDDETESSTETSGSQIIMGFDSDKNFYYAPTLKIDYLSDFTVTLTGEYDWKFLGSVIGKRKSTLVVPLPGMSEYKYNYDKWESES